MLIDPTLTLSFDPDAIREHYEDAPDDHPIAAFVRAADDETLTAIGREAICDEGLWQAFDNALDQAVSYAIHR